MAGCAAPAVALALFLVQTLASPFFPGTNRGFQLPMTAISFPAWSYKARLSLAHHCIVPCVSLWLHLGPWVARHSRYSMRRARLRVERVLCLVLIQSRHISCSSWASLATHLVRSQVSWVCTDGSGGLQGLLRNEFDTTGRAPWGCLGQGLVAPISQVLACTSPLWNTHVQIISLQIRVG